ncbi:MAG: hypothetical protein GX973_05365 [Firmicutes bacterium]|nr:hypothetical protein [Bacillota bacterium]
MRLLNQNIAAISRVFTDIFNQSVALRWPRELLFYPRETAEYYQERLYVSRSTLLRHLMVINRFLARKGMSVQCKNNRYRL